MNAMTAEGGKGSAAGGTAVLAGMMRLALSIRDLLDEESEEGRVAIACAARNRMRRFGLPLDPGAARDIADPDLCRALALACLVLLGDLADPTDGATHFHRHTDQPDWAAGATAKALIGQHIFYALDRQPGR
jgi:hypothetical protein